MQIGGLGGSHGSGDHHVTNCIHDHHETQKNTGGAAMKTTESMEISAAKSELQQEGQFSLAAWLKNTLGNGRGFLLNFRGDGQMSDGTEGKQITVSGTESSQSAVSQAVVHAADSSTTAAVVTAAQQAMQPHVIYKRNDLSDTENQKQTFWQKLRVRFRNVSERKNGRLSQRFFSFQTKNSFQTRQENTREDLRRHSRCHRDTVEINAVRLEDDYLMDSYDRRGEYSRLTTKK